MNCISQWMSDGKRDQPVWSAEIRKRLETEEDSVPLIIRLLCPDGREREFPCRLPYWDSEEEAALALDWFSLQLFNMLSMYSAKKVTVFYTTADDGVKILLQEGVNRFNSINGYQKLLKIARRITGEDLNFELRFVPALPDMKPEKEVPSGQIGNTFARRLAQALQTADEKSGCGIDVGGTDIKLAASWSGRLIAVKEYDWNPAALSTAEELLKPLVLLTSLMAACLTAAVNGGKLPADALKREASETAMTSAINDIISRYGSLLKFDGIGLSFPDIVIHDRILGGETSKTMGIRNNHCLDYETELKKLAGLNELLLQYGQKVHAVNDGHMAAFTTAVEQFAGGDVPHGAVCAHSMGTDLGSGWLNENGDAPMIPYECCNLVFDLGSFTSNKLPAKDIRSVLNENYNLPVAAKYLGQSAAFRLCFRYKPELISEFIGMNGETPVILTAPEDMRKPCLEKIMQAAAQGDESAQNVFRQIGVYLARITQELEFLSPTGTEKRTLYGRFVKNSICFELLQEGFRTVCPEIQLMAADESLACSGLMRQLSMFSDVTVAQFAQAVGAIEYAFY